MEVKNNLKRRLEGLGIKHMVPTDDLLSNKLDGMTLIRFNKILANSSKNELTIREVRFLTKWLAEITGQAEANIELVEPVTQGKEVGQ